MLTIIAFHLSLLYSLRIMYYVKYLLLYVPNRDVEVMGCLKVYLKIK